MFISFDFFTSLASKFRDQVQNGSIKIGANEYPSFLYPVDTVYDPTNDEEGLFRGHIFIRVSISHSLSIYACQYSLQTLRAIYTGKGSALDGYCITSKESQGEIHHMREVFAEAVGNAAVQVNTLILSHMYLMFL